MDDDGLKQLFEEHGEVSSAKIIKDRETNRSRGFGFVSMDDDAADAAISSLDGSEIDGRNLKVNKSKGKS